MNKIGCVHFQFLPMGHRVLFTSALIVLSTGYLFAMIYIFSSHAGRDGKPGLSVNDLIIAYSGSDSDTRLEAALKGPMANMLPDAEKIQISAWVRSGAEKQTFGSSGVESIIANRCLTCHNGTNPHIPNFSEFDNLATMTEKDTGMDLFTLVRVSHIHLFGITFIFFIVSTIFSHAYIRPLWVKCLLIVIPFVAILADIASWYLTKVFAPFAWVVMISGALMGASFAAQFCISIYQIWWLKLPGFVIENEGRVS
ncbi:MAG: hypothetical protein ACC707_14040 [Thiohalomonadales bacterium]